MSRPQDVRASGRDLHVLLAEAQTSETALHDLYLATAPGLAYALAAAADQDLAEDVLVRVYRKVWRRPRSELTALTDDAAVQGWLLRLAVVELAALRRSAARQATG